MKYKEELKKFIGTHVKYDEWGGGYIWGENENQMVAQTIDVDEPPYEGREPETPIVSIRGWGAIQHLFKTQREQEDFQDELGRFIADAINEKLEKL